MITVFKLLNMHKNDVMKFINFQIQLKIKLMTRQLVTLKQHVSMIGLIQAHLIRVGCMIGEAEIEREI